MKTLISLIAVIAFLSTGINATSYSCGGECSPEAQKLIDAFKEQDAKTTTDDIVKVYNSTCVKTHKWKYFFVLDHDEELRESNDILIEVTEIVSKKNKIAKGNIYYP